MGCDNASTPKNIRGKNKQTCILRKGGIRFYRKRRELPHISSCIHITYNVSSTLRTQNNGFNNTTVTQWRTGKHLCPVQVWVDIITRLESYPGTSDNTPVNTVWAENLKKLYHPK